MINTAPIVENITENSLIIVSNREPYEHKRSGPHIKVSKPAGGLTSAMDEVLSSTGGTWIAWGSGNADRETVDSNGCVSVPPHKPSYLLKRVWLTAEEANNYYHGYSNQVLWPLCHIALERVFFRKRYWDSYKKVNQAFAKAVLEQADEKSIIWIHDYHLCLVPEILKEKNPDLTVAHFWHIPWPDYGVFRICPQSREIIEALLRNDLIGFQIPLFVQNFIDCVKESLLDAEIDYKDFTITYKDHITHLKAFPISVDYRKFESFASSRQTESAILKLKERYNLFNTYIGIGVDRLEYTKGLIKRFKAIDLFFDSYPEFRQNFTFIQIAVSTRSKEPYISYKATIEGFIRKINRKYATDNWRPIVYRDTKTGHKDLAAYYRMADVAIISSIYDGMNLVAKEFVASQIDKKGVLLLSELTGAAEELEGSILVNPYDIEEFSECIRTALKLPSEEKKCRMKTLRMQVKENDIYNWISDVIKEIAILLSMKPRRYRYFFKHTEEVPRDNIFLFLDYDGTITPIARSPDKAILSKYTRSLIIKLKDMVPVAVISGRSLDNIMRMVRIDNIFYAGNHGAEIWDGHKLVVSQNLGDNKNILDKIIKELKTALSTIEGVAVEEKGITASIHFRAVKTRDSGKLFDTFWEIADRYKGLFRITSGKKVFEIRPYGIWNKGDAVKWICKNFAKKRVPIYIGDDVTDEDVFKEIRGKGVGISVGRCQTSDYYLKNQKEVKKLLRWIGKF
jgi:alpha,alpha-trehalose-phosphate synthase [UDP-forming]/trehalose-phosphatase